MFLGEFKHTLDAKYRATIPSKFREELGSEFVVTKGLDECIFLYALKEWREIEEKLRLLPLTRADVRAFVRVFFSGASEMEIDKQGRAIIPSGLREYAGIEKDIYVIGVGSRIEIWAQEKWEKYNQDVALSYEDIAESIMDLGI